MNTTTITREVTLIENGAPVTRQESFEVEKGRYADEKVKWAIDFMKVLRVSSADALLIADTLVGDWVKTNKDGNASIKVGRTTGKGDDKSCTITEAVKQKTASTAAFRVAYSVTWAMNAGKSGFLPVSTIWKPNESLQADIDSILRG